ncbi:hypothetical protein ABEG17_04315 [Pedococcus sp. KACC 23699]|uniref:DUF4190 domain-containing protein n=1 Tax=Pedococcus sp. KACC 23699 TaxID=3149228 RepID=A0AAU7JXG7_9MICO
MVVRDVPREGRDAGPQGRPTPGDRAYRRAWWSLALYPLSFVASFIVGEGIFSALTSDTEHPSVWQVLTAGVPALLVFVLPGVLAVWQGRRAMRSGRSDGRVPAIVGAAIGGGFVVLNLASYLVGLVVQ